MQLQILGLLGVESIRPHLAAKGQIQGEIRKQGNDQPHEEEEQPAPATAQDEAARQQQEQDHALRPDEHQQPTQETQPGSRRPLTHVQRQQSERQRRKEQRLHPAGGCPDKGPG